MSQTRSEGYCQKCVQVNSFPAAPGASPSQRKADLGIKRTYKNDTTSQKLALLPKLLVQHESLVLGKQFIFPCPRSTMQRPPPKLRCVRISVALQLRHQDSSRNRCRIHQLTEGLGFPHSQPLAKRMPNFVCTFSTA